jgi:AraC family transcriptional regulator
MSGLSTLSAPLRANMMQVAKVSNLEAPQTLSTSLLRSAQLAVTRLPAGPRGFATTASWQAEKAYVVRLQTRVLGRNEQWVGGRLAGKGLLPEGTMDIVHLENTPVACIPGEVECLQYYLPEVAFDELAREYGAPRISEFGTRSGIIDPVMQHVSRSLVAALENPVATSAHFFDYLVIAAYSHLATHYGRLRPGLARERAGLSVAQERLAKEMLTADLTARLTLMDIARACGMPLTQFIRAFGRATGMPPYRWLRSFRIDRAKQVLFNSSLSLAQVAYDCGFADQSHFTRVFFATVGMTPGAWRRARRDNSRLVSINDGTTRPARQ